MSSVETIVECPRSPSIEDGGGPAFQSSTKADPIARVDEVEEPWRLQILSCYGPEANNQYEATTQRVPKKTSWLGVFCVPILHTVALCLFDVLHCSFLAFARAHRSSPIT